MTGSERGGGAGHLFPRKARISDPRCEGLAPELKHRREPDGEALDEAPQHSSRPAARQLVDENEPGQKGASGASLPRMKRGACSGPWP